jgi:hypothetical protein
MTDSATREDKERLDWLESLGMFWQLKPISGNARYEFFSPDVLVGQKSITRSSLRAAIDAARKERG